MDKAQIVQELDSQIQRLQQARQLLVGQNGTRSAVSSNGRSGPRQMSAAARAKISAAQKKRWAAVKAGKKK